VVGLFHYNPVRTPLPSVSVSNKVEKSFRWRGVFLVSRGTACRELRRDLPRYLEAYEWQSHLYPCWGLAQQADWRHVILKLEIMAMWGIILTTCAYAMRTLIGRVKVPVLLRLSRCLAKSCSQMFERAGQRGERWHESQGGCCATGFYTRRLFSAGRFSARDAIPMRATERR
jgi:hypothetical protein